ncbi:beta-carotene ketolase CrtW [Leptolyngbya sp. FACHB-261]|uniref:beta-carotene ketolase CrtW n=1 Tax=Leptolyngbya sp. FACHB-261 TaxID=2692806 RepID=UPI001682F2EA|nr:fatty acid desaturase [Leptolyngbya sp. FACHB-261]MBD2101882.1 fatty acid desaturase [Leptolyngbya sp. FACHB-261]
MVELEQALSSRCLQTVRAETKAYGLTIALTVILLWAGSLAFLLSLDVPSAQTWWVWPAMLWQTFLYTGLFVTAHDAMHGGVYPQNSTVNRFVGSLAVRLYALFSYEKLLKRHGLHHQHPASQTDPDFHDGENQNVVIWYLQFMKRYWSWTQIFGLMIVFNIFSRVLHVSELNLTLFWVVPSLLSSVQLFFFGTYLPHHEPEGGYQNQQHRTQSSGFPIFWSFVTCYHFGYHEEHHEYPQVPWWRLPTVHKVLSQQPEVPLPAYSVEV